MSHLLLCSFAPTFFVGPDGNRKHRKRNHHHDQGQRLGGEIECGGIKTGRLFTAHRSDEEPI